MTPASAPSVPVFFSLKSTMSSIVRIEVFEIWDKYSFMPLYASTFTTVNSDLLAAPRVLSSQLQVSKVVWEDSPIPATIWRDAFFGTGEVSTKYLGAHFSQFVKQIHCHCFSTLVYAFPTTYEG